MDPWVELSNWRAGLAPQIIGLFPSLLYRFLSERQEADGESLSSTAAFNAMIFKLRKGPICPHLRRDVSINIRLQN